MITKFLNEKTKFSSLVQTVKKMHEIKKLAKIPSSPYSTQNLIHISNSEKSSIFEDQQTRHKWNSVSGTIEKFALPEMMGGVNKGDQRALFYLICHYKPRNILEVGTHIGCSTAHISMAIKNMGSRLTTVDRIDVNDPVRSHWSRFDCKFSPRELTKIAGAESQVDFVAEDSLHFLSNSKEKFDFIFLDGSHKADMVFREIQLAMTLLNRNGIILLHDYFPGNNPLWKSSQTIPGPFLAVERLMKEEKNISIRPLNTLPWETKKGSHYTSLAIVIRTK